MDYGRPKELRRTAHSMSSSLLQKKSEHSLVPKIVAWQPLNRFLITLQIVFIDTKLCPLFPAVPLAIAAQMFHFGNTWVFALSLIGLVPLAERVSFLSEHVAEYAGPTVGGLLNATCGNVPELIIALLSLHNGKIDILKWSLLGSILSNLLLVLGSSFFLGGLVNLSKERQFDRMPTDVNLSLLLLASVCHIFALACHYATTNTVYNLGTISVLSLSKSLSIIMLVAYCGGLVFHLKTHRQLFELPEDDGNNNDGDSDDDTVSDTPVIGFLSALGWLVVMTAFVAILSNNVVNTIEAASASWGLSLSFITVIMLPIVGNAAEHASAVVFAFKNKIDITLGVCLGSATQISMFLIPLVIIVAWTKGIYMDLDFELLETVSLIMAIIVTAFILQDQSWHYMKGFILMLCYVVISAMFFFNGTRMDAINPDG